MSDQAVSDICGTVSMLAVLWYFFVSSIRD
jgi:hypothetical protein